MEKIIIAHISQSMLITFFLGLICLFLYCWKTSKENNIGYTTQPYMRLTWPNVVFHLIASFLVLMLLNEISEILIDNFIPVLKGSEFYHNTLAALTGLFGSRLVAFVLEKARKIRNEKDENIKHVHKNEH